MRGRHIGPASCTGHLTHHGLPTVSVARHHVHPHQLHITTPTGDVTMPWVPYMASYLPKTPQPPHLLPGASRRADEGERNRAKRHVEQAPALR